MSTNIGAKQIMLEALQGLKARRHEVSKSVSEIRATLADAMAEERSLERAIKMQETAMARVDRKTASRSSSNGSAPGSVRPWSTHEPGEDTHAGKVLKVLRVNGGEMTVGNVATRAGMPGPPVRKALIELMERGYIRRVREGTYEAESTDNDGTEQVEVVRAKPAFDEDGKP